MWTARLSKVCRFVHNFLKVFLSATFCKRRSCKATHDMAFVPHTGITVPHEFQFLMFCGVNCSRLALEP